MQLRRALLQRECHCRLFRPSFGGVPTAESELKKSGEVTALLEILLHDRQAELPRRRAAGDDGGTGGQLPSCERRGSSGGAGHLLGGKREGREAVTAVGEGLGVAGHATENVIAGKAEETVVNGEDKLGSDLDQRVTEEEIKVAGNGPIEGIFGRDDGAVGYAGLERSEGVFHVLAWKSGDGTGEGAEAHGGGLMGVGAAAALVRHAERAGCGCVRRAGEEPLEGDAEGEVLGGLARAEARRRRST